MTMKENRRRFLAEEKVKILRKHLVEKAPISDVCDEWPILWIITIPGGCTVRSVT
jgi:transposase-like protein